jgi:hypothetical protein
VLLTELGQNRDVQFSAAVRVSAPIRSRVAGVGVARTSVTVAAPAAPAPAGQTSGVKDITRRAVFITAHTFNG